MTGRISIPLLALFAAVAALAAAGALLTPASVEGQEAAKYVGSEKCKMCHMDQHGVWLKMKHSKAWSSLTPEQIADGKDEQGRACVQCHTTGYGKDGGFVSAEKTPELTGVGCEACHGPGSVHMKTMMMAAMEEAEVPDKKISRDVGCTGCHNPHISYKELYGSK